MKPFAMAREGPRLHPWRSTGYSSIKQGCVMPIDTISVKCRRDAHPCVVRNSTSPLRKRAYGASLPSAVPGVRRSVRQKRHGPGKGPLAKSVRTFKAPKYSNCLIFAFRLWLTGGGYLLVRKSRAGWFPHFLWCADLADAMVLHFAPRNIAPWWYRPIHMLLFSGVVKRDDR